MELPTIHLRTMCPACRTQSKIAQPRCYAAVAPWVTELSNSKRIISQYLICGSCSSGYFELTYSDRILTALYSGYRGNTYFHTRHRWDLDYSERLNTGLSKDPAWLEWRRNNVMDVLIHAGIPENSITRCLDIGGGEGGVIPNFSKARKYVLESNEAIQYSSDISRISNFEEISSINPDLIMCCGLLEHLNNPHEFIMRLVSSASSSKWFYFEVPAGVPTIRQGVIGKKTFLKVLNSNRMIWNIYNRLSKIILNRFSINITILRISEHLNFFTAQGLTRLMQSCNLEVVLISEFDTNMKLPDQQNLHFQTAWKVLCRNSYS